MEMINLYCWGAIGAVFCLVVGAMWGYCRQEAQQVHANALQRDHLQAVDAKWRELLQDAEDNARSHYSKWAYADKYRAALVDVMTINYCWDFDKHGDNPLMMLAHLVTHERAEALDPSVSQKAKNLHTAGVRKGAKRGRLQMQKLMQKSIDNQADTINKLYAMYDKSNERTDRIKTAVTNVLNDKVALPSVRKSIRNGINVECERLRLISEQQGA
jgi:hypothetical protein